MGIYHTCSLILQQGPSVCCVRVIRFSECAAIGVQIGMSDGLRQKATQSRRVTVKDNTSRTCNQYKAGEMCVQIGGVVLVVGKTLCVMRSEHILCVRWGAIQETQ